MRDKERSSLGKRNGKEKVTVEVDIEILNIWKTKKWAFYDK
jgi:hypothetical protein